MVSWYRRWSNTKRDLIIFIVLCLVTFSLVTLFHRRYTRTLSAAMFYFQRSSSPVLTVNPHSFRFISSHGETCSGNETLVVTVLSSAKNFEHRTAIRETWAKTLKEHGAKVVFLMGLAASEMLRPMVDEEDRIYNDIVQEDFIESYYNLSLKSVMMTRWITYYCAETSFVLKVDDDVLINVPRLLSVVHNLTYQTQPTIWGYLASGWAPRRDDHSKWYVPLHLFNGTVFPDFLTGPGYLFNKGVAPLLYNTSFSVRYLYLEDVYLTGLVAEKAGVVRVHHKSFTNTRRLIRACTGDEGLVVSHGFTPEYLKVAWKNLLKRQSLCPYRKFFTTHEIG